MFGPHEQRDEEIQHRRTCCYPCFCCYHQCSHDTAYANLITLIHTCVGSYYSTIQVIGLSKLPSYPTPLIFVLNHQNALMDALVLQYALRFRRKIHHLAKEPLFHVPILGDLMNSVGTIPVYRKEDFQGEKQSHDDMFRSVYRTLGKGECITIFPEGTSHDQPYLRQLKVGVALIACKAAIEQGIENVHIIPVGLEFFEREKFRSQAVVEFGDAFRIPQELIDEYHEYKEEKVNPVVDKVLDIIDGRLRNISLNVPDWETFYTVRLARRLFQPHNLKLSFEQYQEVNRVFDDSFAVSHEDDNELHCLKEDIKHYRSILDGLRIEDEHVVTGKLHPCIAVLVILIRIIVMIVLFPVVVPPVVLNLPMYLISSYLSHRAAAAEAKESIDKGYQQEGYKALDVLATYKLFYLLVLIPTFYSAYGITSSYYLTRDVRFFENILLLSGRGWSFSEGILWFFIVIFAISLLSLATLNFLDSLTIAVKDIISTMKISFFTTFNLIQQLREQRRVLQIRVRAIVRRLSLHDCDVRRSKTVLHVMRIVEEEEVMLQEPGEGGIWGRANLFRLRRYHSTTLTTNPLCVPFLDESPGLEREGQHLLHSIEEDSKSCIED